MSNINYYYYNGFRIFKAKDIPSKEKIGVITAVRAFLSEAKDREGECALRNKEK